MAQLLKQLLLSFIHRFAKASLGFCATLLRDILDTESWVLEHFRLSVALVLH